MEVRFSTDSTRSDFSSPSLRSSSSLHRSSLLINRHWNQGKLRLGKRARAHPRKDGCTRERDIVDFHQSEACLPKSSRQSRQHKLFLLRTISRWRMKTNYLTWRVIVLKNVSKWKNLEGGLRVRRKIFPTQSFGKILCSAANVKIR